MAPILAGIHMATFDVREGMPGLTDRTAIREVWTEDVYRLNGRDLKGVTVVDVGAHIGAFSVRCAKMGARVFAFEPDATNVERLIRNVGINGLKGLVTVEQFAVGGTAPLLRLAPDGDTGMLKTSSDADDPTYPCISLDEAVQVIEVNGSIHGGILKVDCEGGEYAIFAAADQATLTRFDYITIETHSLGRPNLVGDLIEGLLYTHHIDAFGAPNTGGMIFSRRYGS